MPASFDVYLNRAKPLYERLLRNGWTPAGASAVLGNFTQESGLDPNAVNPKEGAIGFAQWRKDRRDALQQHVGNAPDRALAQIDFVDRELATDPRYKGLKDAVNTLSPAQGAALFAKVYERPAVIEPSRGTFASQYHSALGGTAPAVVAAQAPPLPAPIEVAQLPTPAGPPAASMPSAPAVVGTPMEKILASLTPNAGAAPAQAEQAPDEGGDMPDVGTNDTEVRALAARVWAKLMQKRGIPTRIG